MARTSAKIQGAKELTKALRKLGERIQRKVLRQAVNAAATPVVKAARAKAEKESGLLRKSLNKKIRTYKKSGTVAAIIGPRTDVQGEYKGKVRKPKHYAHLVEGGHIDEHGNAVPPKPFLRPAFDETKAEAVDVMQDKLAAGIVKEAQRGNRR